MSIEDLRALALADFGPALEAFPDYESRVYRSVALLEARGAPVAEDGLQGRILHARFTMDTAGQEPQEAVRTLRSSLARAPEEDDCSPLRTLRAEAIVSLLSGRSGGAPGGILGRLLNPSSRSASMWDASQSDAPPPGLGRPADGRSRDVSGAHAVGSARIATDPSPASNFRSVYDGTPLAPAGADAISQAILELIRERRGQHQSAVPTPGSEPRSTIQVRPQMKWLQLGDDDYEVPSFLDEFEETVGLANDCRSMNSREKLRVLGQCLKQSRYKAYLAVTKAARQSGELQRDPNCVFEMVTSRLFEFREGLIEQQTRADRDHEHCAKGHLTAMQFFPVWENVLAELELKGIGESEREVLLGYFKRVGSQARTEVLKDRRAYPLPGGGQEVRQVRSWREARALVVEQRQLMEGSRALLGAVQPGESPAGGGDGRARRRGGRSRSAVRGDGDAPSVAAVAASLPEHLRQACWQLRDKGKCDRENSRFDHDPRRVAESKQYASTAEKGAGKGKGKGKGGKGGGNPRPNSHARKTEVCRAHLAGNCTRGDQCRYSRSAKVIAYLSRAILAFECAKNGGAPPAVAQPAPAPVPPSAGHAVAAVSPIISGAAEGGRAPAGSRGGASPGDEVVLQWVKRSPAVPWYMDCCGTAPCPCPWATPSSKRSPAAVLRWLPGD